MAGILKRLAARNKQAQRARHNMHVAAGNPNALDVQALAMPGSDNNPAARAVLTLIPNHPGPGMKITPFFEGGFNVDNPAHQGIAWVMEQIQTAVTAQGDTLEELTPPELVTGAAAEAALQTGQLPDAASEAGQPGSVMSAAHGVILDASGKRMNH